jgi:hypothetical protein
VKAADAVAALKASLKPLATVKRDGAWQNMDAGLLVPGDLVLLAAGSSVPADCLVNHGARGRARLAPPPRLHLAPSPPARALAPPLTHPPPAPPPHPPQAASRSTSRR